MAELAATTQGAPAPQAAPPPTEAGTTASGGSQAAPVEDYKAKYTELEGRYKTAEEDVKAFNQLRQLVARNPELKEHIEARYYGREWNPKTQTMEPAKPQEPAQPKALELPKEVQEKLGKLDSFEQTVQQLQEAQVRQFEENKLDREIKETHDAYPILKDPKMQSEFSNRFNQRVMQVARGYRQQNVMATDEQLISAALAQVSAVPYRTLVWDLMEKEMAQHLAEQTNKGVSRMQNPGGRGDRVVSRPAGQSPNEDEQFEAEMKAASSGKNVDHTKRAEALMRRGVTPRDLGWPD